MSAVVRRHVLLALLGGCFVGCSREQENANNERWIPGTHYELLVPSQPTPVGERRVSVVEIFWYGCPHCATLAPRLSQWARTREGDLDLVLSPGIWPRGGIAHARLFYTLQELGRLDLHQDVFDSIHQQKNSLLGKTEDDTLRVQLEFATSHGIEKQAFTAAYRAPELQARLDHAMELMRRYRIDRVPAIVVAEKYKTDIVRAGGEEQLIALLDELTARELKS